MTNKTFATFTHTWEVSVGLRNCRTMGTTVAERGPSDRTAVVSSLLKLLKTRVVSDQSKAAQGQILPMLTDTGGFGTEREKEKYIIHCPCFPRVCVWEGGEEWNFDFENRRNASGSFIFYTCMLIRFTCPAVRQWQTVTVCRYMLRTEEKVSRNYKRTCLCS